MQVITSKDNERIKEIKKIRDIKKVRDEKKLFVVEGIKMIEEAIKEKAKIVTIVICEDYLSEKLADSKFLYEIAKYDCIYVSTNVFDILTDVMRPQGAIAVIEQPQDAKLNTNEDIIMVLDNLQDPGNLGTIIRTADAVGLSQIMVINNTVDAYNPKVIRSTMGSIFRVKVVELGKDNEIKNMVNSVEQLEISKELEKLKEAGYTVVSTSLQGKKSIFDMEYNKVAFVIGNEANGVSKDVLELSDVKVKIPMKGRAESLNASVAASVVMYEYLRQGLAK